ncbi:MAG TPA: glycosyltransferase family 2 protein [Baekduia sp.]|nr:glycosyltransferase family 2 protein [Baekduia sp.]
MSPTLTYAVVTPVRDEEENLPRLAAAMVAQEQAPLRWVIVDTGSTDGTIALARALAREHPWIAVLELEGDAVQQRGGPIVRAFQLGAASLDPAPDVVVKLDADLSFAPDYFARLAAAFAVDPRLGLASGICTELEDGEWRPIYGTRSHVWGASRAYRWACLQQVQPLEERQGWDEIDAIKAQLRGWSAGTLFDVPFRHHRPEGARDGARRRWRDQGATAHYMGYRFSYLLARTCYRALREPAALAMLRGYATATLRRQPQCPDRSVRAHLRREQGLARLPRRVRESFGRAA